VRRWHYFAKTQSKETRSNENEADSKADDRRVHRVIFWLSSGNEPLRQQVLCRSDYKKMRQEKRRKRRGSRPREKCRKEKNASS